MCEIKRMPSPEWPATRLALALGEVATYRSSTAQDFKKARELEKIWKSAFSQPVQHSNIDAKSKMYDEWYNRWRSNPPEWTSKHARINFINESGKHETGTVLGGLWYPTETKAQHGAADRSMDGYILTTGAVVQREKERVYFYSDRIELTALTLSKTTDTRFIQSVFDVEIDGERKKISIVNKDMLQSQYHHLKFIVSDRKAKDIKIEPIILQYSPASDSIAVTHEGGPTNF
jgi:hypothetical protein